MNRYYLNTMFQATGLCDLLSLTGNLVRSNYFSKACNVVCENNTELPNEEKILSYLKDSIPEYFKDDFVAKEFFKKEHLVILKTLHNRVIEVLKSKKVDQENSLKILKEIEILMTIWLDFINDYRHKYGP